MPAAQRIQRRPLERLLQLTLGGLFAAAALVAMPTQAALVIGNNPLYLVIGKANVLVVLDNSNSMDENAAGAAVGSASPDSKSEIARSVVKSLTDNYRSRINMGLMAYQQGATSSMYLHNSPYDISFNPADYDAAWSGARAGGKKRFRLANPTSPGDFIYYNVALPFYSGSNQGNAFCYSATANASNDFKNGENPITGPWDTYRCFSTKTGTSNTLPTWRDAVSETANGWVTKVYEGGFSPTDSDFAQGITDFGRFNSWNYVSRTYYRNDSPGRGYLHIPLGDLNSTQAANIKAKLACNIPGTPAGCSATGLQNAGLTPIEGTLLTAKDYYKGGWNTAAEGYTASCYPLPVSCGKNFVVLLTDGLPSTNKSGTTLADPVQALKDAAAAAAALKADGVETYVIGFALPYGTDPATLDQIAVAGGTDKAYSAADLASLTATFDTIFQDIFKKSSSFGAVAQNSTSINTGSLVFQGRFDSSDWSGELLAMKPQSDGTMVNSWSTSDAGKIPAAADRKIFTYKPGSGGVAFKTLGDLSATQQGNLTSPNCSASVTGNNCGQMRIDWMRGTRTQEDPAGPMRRRSKVLGDIISSSPYYVKGSNTVFVGANDGMLHAFNAGTGAELFAYVPNAVFSKIYKLSTNSYAHDYYVDGDIAVSTTFETPNKNILVGSLGRGGKALYALDVTDPKNFAATNVLWEFSDADLGLALGRPVIAKANNGKAVVLVGNGPNSTNDRAVLFVIDLETGALIKKIDTQYGDSSASNGMSAPRGWDSDGNGTVDLVYAGDLQGNLWKIDLSSVNTSDWASAFTAASKPAPFFVAKDKDDNRQPISGMVSLGLNWRKGDPNFGKRYVFLGTGRYVTTGDVTDTSTQTWYGLIDEGATISGRAVLKQRTVDLETTVSGNPVRAFSLAAKNDMVGKKGWYMDLLKPDNTKTGERMIGEQKFFGSALLATSMVPSSDQCVPGGEGYLNAVDAFNGGATVIPFFDANNDGLFNDSDRIGANKVAIGSINPKINLPSDGIIIGNRVIASGTSGGIGGAGANTQFRLGRITWREVVNQ